MPFAPWPVGEGSLVHRGLVAKHCQTCSRQDPHLRAGYAHVTRACTRQEPAAHGSPAAQLPTSCTAAFMRLVRIHDFWAGTSACIGPCLSLARCPACELRRTKTALSAPSGHDLVTKLPAKWALAALPEQRCSHSLKPRRLSPLGARRPASPRLELGKAPGHHRRGAAPGLRTWRAPGRRPHRRRAHARSRRDRAGGPRR